MWRLRKAATLAKWSRLWPEVHSAPAGSFRGISSSSSAVLSKLPFQRQQQLQEQIIGRQIFFRNLTTRGKRSASVADSGSEEFSESDELEQESQELRELEEVKSGHVDDDEDEEQEEHEEHEEHGENVKIVVTDDELDAASKAEKKKQTESVLTTRSFGRPDLPLSPKAQELWEKINALPRGEKVVPILESWRDEGNELDQLTMSGIVGRLQRITRYGLALEIVGWLLQQDEFKDAPSLRGSVIECTARCKGIAAAEKYFEELPAQEKTRPVYDAMLSQLVNKGQGRKAEALFEEMEKAGLLSESPYAINTMMRLYKQSRNNKKFQEMLEKAKEANVEPNIQTYNVMLELKCREGDIAGMEKVFEEIKANPDTKPDSVTYATLARAYLNAGDRDKAELYMLRLENGSFRKSKRTYEILMDFYADLGNREEVERLWNKCRVLQGDGASSYLAFMNALSKVGAVDKVERMFQRIDSWKPNKTTDEKRYNNLLHAYRVAGEKVKAEELEKKMKEAGINKITIKVPPPAKKTDSSSKKPAAEKKNKKQVKADGNKDVKTETQNRSSPGNKEAFMKRLEAAAEKGNVKGAEVVFDECRRAKLTDVEMWNRLLKAYVKAGMPAYGFLLRMSADKVTPNEETNKMLEGMTA